MANITISVEENLLRKTKEYARKQKTSVNKIIKTLLEQTVGKNNFPEDFLATAEKLNISSKGSRLTRESLYE